MGIETRIAEGTVHICAAPNEEVLERLAQQLHTVRVTHAGQIKPGDELEKRRREMLDDADMIVLLVSAPFVVMPEHDTDVARAMERDQDGTARCVAVLAHPCAALDALRYEHLLTQPNDGRPLVVDGGIREDALARVADWVQSNTLVRKVTNPFPGLRSFAREDARHFFGREKELKEALDRLSEPGPPSRWLLIDGPSGAGKSSFARAGIVPAVLARNVAGVPEKWVTVEMRPGHDPITSLAEALVRHATPKFELGNRHLADVKRDLLEGGADALALLLREGRPKDHGVLLVVDQFEEVFTLAHANAPAVKRFDALLAAALHDDEGLPLLLVTPLRNDFLETMTEVPELHQRYTAKQLVRTTLRWMGKRSLRAVIEKPAEQAGLRYEAGLVDRIVRDAFAAREGGAGGDERTAPGALPLVAHLLETLYTERERRVLTMRAYQAAGGVGGALAQGADAIIAALDDDGQERARRLLLRLVTFGRNGEAIPQTSKRDGALEAAGGGGEAHDVLRRLSGGPGPGPAGIRKLPGRLVAESGEAGSETVDLVHVALIQRWSKLRKWIEEASSALKLRDMVEKAAQIWMAHDRDEGLLPSGTALLKFQGVPRAELHDDARVFRHAAAMAELRREEKERLRRDAESKVEQLRSKRRRRRRILGVAALLLGLVFLVTRSFWLAHKLETTKRAEIQQANMNMAAMFAGMMLSQLRALSDAVERAGREDVLSRALKEGDIPTVQAFCEAKFKFYDDPSHGFEGSPFNMWFVADREGFILAQYPLRAAEKAIMGKNYSFRDYYDGTLKMAGKRLRSAYVSRAFRSENDNLYKFAVSVPIYGDNDQLVGLLVAGIASNADLGYKEPKDVKSKAVLVAPRGPERVEPTGEPPYLILRHSELAYGSAVGLENPYVRTASEASLADPNRYERLLWPADHTLVKPCDRYQDPMGETDSRYAGNWLAGFAPVGSTGFVVIVQTPETEATDDARQFIQLTLWAAFLATIGTALGLAPAGTFRYVTALARWLKTKLRALLPTSPPREYDE